MVKHTKDGFGYAVDAEVAPFGGVSLRQALPSEYLTRLDLTNEALGDDLRFEGFTRMGDQPALRCLPQVHAVATEGAVRRGPGDFRRGARRHAEPGAEIGGGIENKCPVSLFINSG